MIKSIQHFNRYFSFPSIPCGSNVPYFAIQGLLCVLILFLTGCKQDPFGDFSEEFRNQLQRLAHYVPEEPEEEDAQGDTQTVSGQFARILGDDFWQVFTGQEFQTILNVKVLLEEDQFDDLILEITSPEFEGENYSLTQLEQNSSNERAYLFKWIPSLRFLGDQFEKLTQVHFKLKIFGPLNLETRPQTFSIFIKRSFYAPEVRLVDMPSFLQKGDEALMRVHVLDENATEENPPVLIFNPLPRQEGHAPRDLNQLLSFIQRKKLEREEYIWEFEYQITTQFIEEFDRDQMTYALNMSAYSQYSGLSEEQTVLLTIADRILTPTVTGPQMITAPVGQTLSIVLYVLDSAGGGRLSSQVLNLEEIPGTVELHDEIEEHRMTSTLIWTVPEDIDASKNYEVQLEVMNKGTQNAQTIEESVIHTIVINLQNSRVLEVDTNDPQSF